VRLEKASLGIVENRLLVKNLQAGKKERMSKKPFLKGTLRDTFLLTDHSDW
jgi:hypothetical protein